MAQRQKWLKHAPLIGGSVLVLVLVAGLVWMIHRFMSNKDKKPERLVQNITVIRPPPPPPEDQPPPPPPEKVEQEIPKDVPEPSPDEAAQSNEQLGVDAEGSAGSDSFGLAARHGGADLVGGHGAAFAWYTGKLKDEVTDRLSADPKLRSKKYTIGIRVWIETGGRIKEVRLTSSTGSVDLDHAITVALNNLGSLGESPPLEMPQPISLRIVSRT